MAIDLNECYKEINSILNSTAIGTTGQSKTAAVAPIAPTIDKKWPQDVTVIAVADAIAEFGALIAETPNHPDQATMMTHTFPLANQTRVTTTIAPKAGPFLGCRVTFAGAVPPTPPTAPIAVVSADLPGYWVADPASVIDIKDYILDKTAPVLGLTSPWYAFAVESGFLYHTGVAAILGYVPSNLGEDLIPEKYKNGIVSLALSILFPFEGDSEYVNAAAHYYKIAMDAIERIRQGSASGAVVPFTGA